MTFYRRLLSQGWSKADARELAQEAIVQVLEQLQKLTRPQCLYFWAFNILRRVKHDYRKRNTKVAARDQLLEAIPDRGQMEVGIEHNILMGILVGEIRCRLRNRLEQTVFLRWLLFGGQSREIANDLGLTLHQTMIVKHQAIQRLKGNEEFCNILLSLVDTDDRSRIGNR